MNHHALPSARAMTHRGFRPTTRLHSLVHVEQPRGNLTVGEFPGQLPFVPIRVFVVSGVPDGGVRGQHAHRECHQFLIATRGSLMVEVWDGEGHRNYTLDSPDMGLHMPPMTFGSQHSHSSDAQLLVLASNPYDVRDYMDSFGEFCRAIDRTFEVGPDDIVP